MPSFSPALGTCSFTPARSHYQFLAVTAAGQLDNGASLEVWTDLTGSWESHTFTNQSTSFGSVLVARVPVKGKGSYQFTYRIKHSSSDVTWLSQAAGLDNGSIIVKLGASGSNFNPLKAATLDADGAPTPITDDIDVVARTLKFSLTEGEEGSIESFEVVTLGGFSSGLAIERSKPTWFTPRILNANSGLSSDFDCQFLLYQSGTQAVACFPLSLSDASSTLRGCNQGSDTVWLRSEREKTGSANAQCVVAWGPDHRLLEVVHACVEKAKEVINADTPSRSDSQIDDNSDSSSWSLHETSKAVFCTWNSLGQDYTFSGVLERLNTLQKSNTLSYFEALLLDDGWQDVASSPENANIRWLRSFGIREGWMNKDGTSQNTLETAIQTIKTDYPDIKEVGVWMTLQGYWQGLDPDSEISQMYSLTKYGVRNSGCQDPHAPPTKYIHLPAAEDTERYFTDYFTTLKQAGVDFVKIDNQAAADYLVGPGAAECRKRLSRTARAVAYKIFGPGNLINCMAGSPRYYNEFLSSRSSPSTSLRTSDDFFPNEPDSHRYHIAFNATTAYLDRELAVTRDFDMFTTHHPLAEYHAPLRCFSKAPLYITDNEASNQRIFQRLGGPDAQGQFKILKATENAAVKLPSTAFTDVTATGVGPCLKVGLPVSAAQGAIIGLWNCRGGDAAAIDVLTKREVIEALRLGRDKKVGSERFVLMYDSGNATEVGYLEEDESVNSDPGTPSILMPLHLPPSTSKTITIAAIQSYESLDLAVLGLADKFAGLCAVLRVGEPKEEGEKVESVGMTNGHHQEEEEPTEIITDEAAAPAKEASEQEESLSSYERTPLLPKAQAVTASSCRKGSRILALIFFLRRDLRDARSSFLQDFLRAPFSTLYKELRAMFGGPSTLPYRNETPSEDINGPAEAEPEMEEASQAIPKTYGTMSNSVTGKPESNNGGDVSTASTSMDTLVDGPAAPGNEVVIHLSVAGKLILWISNPKPEDLAFTLQGEAIPTKFLQISGSCVVIDTEAAAAQASLHDSLRDSSTWEVGISKK